MSLLLNQVKIFLESAARGESKGISPKLIEEFKEACGNSLEKQFNQPNTKRIRMSALGKPLCQQQLDINSDEEEQVDYTLLMKFLMGDLLEALAIAIMKSAGVNIESEQEPVELTFSKDGKNFDIVNGTYDVKIDGKVYDIKTASPAAFNTKFGSFGGYSKIKSDDPFGYVVQGYLYAEAAGYPFGGWIAINKATGEWSVCETPELTDRDRQDALDLAKSNLYTILDKKPFKKCFKETPEVVRKRGQSITTGNKLLPKNCSYCGYREHCWPKSSYERKPSIREDSKAHAWYAKYVTSDL